ncbi:hypothetical protein SAMN03159496_05841 [Rhizobium sp. NFR07]|uniref:hypothetical protein n=1 Tax=Rhizobium sp. NFR07 TaxID=1566262 RepID=UPI0008EC8263|nr:hypothetical protein [Rhizobium sp. NFR07]SFB61551.1 hypothetical protein SAMN03159496_05841 [Rhizobium sp. NFR07]
MLSMKIRTLLPVLFISLLLMVIALGAIAINSLSSINKQVSLLGDTQAKATGVMSASRKRYQGSTVFTPSICFPFLWMI